jgi:hypothetical protein
MKTVKFVSKHFGENSTTSKSIVSVYDPLNPPSLEEMKWCCLSYDNDMMVQVHLYGIKEVELPDWMNPEEFVYSTTNINYYWLWGFGADKDWPESWQKGLMAIPSQLERYVAIKLLKTKSFRSEFRKSIRDKVVEWLESSERKYASPFTQKMLNAVSTIHDVNAVRRLDKSLYYSGR